MQCDGKIMRWDVICRDKRWQCNGNRWHHCHHCNGNPWPTTQLETALDQRQGVVITPSSEQCTTNAKSVSWSSPPPSPIFISFSLNTAGTIIKRLPLARLTSNQSRSSIALRASFSPFSSLVRHLSRLRLHLSHLTLYLSSFSYLIYMPYIPVYCTASNMGMAYFITFGLVYSTFPWVIHSLFQRLR